MRSLCAVLALMACTEREPDTIIVNGGGGCIYAWPPTLDRDANLEDTSVHAELSNLLSALNGDQFAFQPGDPILVAVTRAASGCATNVDASCSIERDGQFLYVKNRASWDEPDYICVSREPPPFARAYCKLDALDAGNYEIRFAGNRGSLRNPPDGEWFDSCF